MLQYRVRRHRLHAALLCVNLFAFVEAQVRCPEEGCPPVETVLPDLYREIWHCLLQTYACASRKAMKSLNDIESIALC